MSTFKIDDFIHLGIDKGVEKSEWIIALDREYKQVIKHGFADGYDPFTFNTDMHVEEYIFDGDIFPRPLTDVYWNGHTPIWVKVRVWMNGKHGSFVERYWEPEFRANDGTIIPATNPLDPTDIPKYNRQKLQ